MVVVLSPSVVGLAIIVIVAMNGVCSSLVDSMEYDVNLIVVCHICSCIVIVIVEYYWYLVGCLNF